MYISLYIATFIFIFHDIDGYEHLYAKEHENKFDNISVASKTFLPKNCGKTIYNRESVNVRIVGGRDATLGQFPWIARLGYKNRNGRVGFYCGASLISTYYVITAAHCDTIGNIVRLGDNYLDTDRDCDDKKCAPKHQDIVIKLRHSHSQYSKADNTNDISLIELIKPAIFNEYVQPICLSLKPIPHNKLINTKASISGWGYIESQHKKQTKRLKQITAPIVNPIRCNNVYTNNLQDTQWCIGSRGGNDSCEGDSGGPVSVAKKIVRDDGETLIGLVSFGLEICGIAPAIYTDVSQYLSWINKQIKK